MLVAGRGLCFVSGEVKDQGSLPVVSSEKAAAAFWEGFGMR